MSMRRTRKKKNLAILILALFVFSFMGFVPGTSDAADLQAEGAGIEAGAAGLEAEGAGLEGEGAEPEGEGAGLENEGAGLEGEGAELEGEGAEGVRIEAGAAGLRGEGSGLDGEGAGLKDEDPGLDAMVASSSNYPVSDKNITPEEYEGNTPKGCDFKIDEEGTKVNGTWNTDYGKITISGDGTFFSWEFDSTTHAVSSVLVKGGPNYHDYDYSGTGYSSDGNLASPRNPGGNIAAISHLCFNFVEREQPDDPGSLKIIKKVEGLKKWDKGPDFEITITGPSYPNGNTKTFSRWNDLVKTWDNLIPGEYTISEGDLDPGWTASGLGKVTVVSGEAVVKIITNTYKKPTPGSLKVNKVVKGLGKWEKGPKFYITITGPSYPNGNTKEFSRWWDLEKTWDNLIPGEYTITEANPGPGWNAEGLGMVTVVPGKRPTTVTVTNTFTKPDPEKGNIQVSKVVEGIPDDPDFEVPDFEITITGKSDGASYPDGNTVTLSYPDSLEYTWQNLEPGDYEITEGDLGVHWDAAFDPEGLITVVKGGTCLVTVTNTYDYKEPEGDLEITKVVRRGNRDIVWEFYLEIDGEPYVGEYTVGDDIRETDDGTLELKHGETAVIKGLDVGTKYSVEEESYRGYTTRSTNEEGTIDEDGVVVTFYNSRSGGGGGGGSSTDRDREDDDDDRDEEEEIIVPELPDPEAPIVVEPPVVPDPVVVPEEPQVMAPVKAPAMPKTGGYPLAMASLGTMLLGLGVYLRRK